MSARPVLGRGLGALIPQKKSLTEQIIPEARQEILDVEINKIKTNPRQPRKYFSPSDLEDLINSIQEYGILQPLIVTKIKDGYELIAGERRLRASTTLGLNTVPAIVRNATDQEKLELALIENIQRADLNVIEEAIAYKALMDEFNLSQNDVAKRVGKSRPVVANAIRLLDLPENILDALIDGRIYKSHARALLAETDSTKQDQMFRKMLKGEMTAVEAESKATGLMPKRQKKGKDPNIIAHEKRLREILGTKVSINESAGKGAVTLYFYSREELMDLLDVITE